MSQRGESTRGLLNNTGNRVLLAVLIGLGVYFLCAPAGVVGIVAGQMGGTPASVVFFALAVVIIEVLLTLRHRRR